MSVVLQDLQKTGMKKGMPRFKTGQTVKVYRKIREGEKERTQMFAGLIIEVKAQSSNAATITVRKIVGGVGVEQVFPIHSPLIEKIELIKEAKVRRAKLYFMRALRGKAARLRERFLSADELKAMQVHEVTEEEVEEAVVAEEKAKKMEEEAAEKEGNEAADIEKA